MSKRTKGILWAVGVFAAMVASAILFDVPLPHIQIPPETVATLPFGGEQGFPITNTMISLFLADLVLLFVAWRVRSKLSLVPSGMQNVIEAVYGYWHDQATQMIGPERTKRWLPLALTMFLLITTANWLELLPGFDTIGIACVPGECPGEYEGMPEVEHTMFSGERYGGLFVATARDTAAHHGDEADHGDDADHSDEAVVDESGAEDDGHADEVVAEGDHGADGEGGSESRVLVPFFRVASTDLNFTLALALIGFVVVEFAGIRTHGWRYPAHFFDLRGSFGDKALAIFIGIIEVISELARIVTWSFRLFGNLFAGQVLLFIMPFLVPFALVLPFYGLEAFVGMIQGFVFAILLLVFMSLAIVQHDEH